MRLVAIVVLASCAVDEPTVSVVEQEMNVCADGPTTYGIDVSRFQGDINWDQVAGSGVKFAYIQISRSLTDIDLKFPYNWRRAKEVGILRGAYQRFRPGMDVMGQAKLFIDKLGAVEPNDLPPMLDVEDADGLTGPQIAAAVQQWMSYVEPRVAKKPLIYTGFYFWRDSVGGADFSAHPLWIANYSATCPLVPPHWTRWALHQYSSSATIPGVTANTVDVNKFNGTLADLQALGTPPEPPGPCQIIRDGADSIVDDASDCFRAGGDPQSIREANAGYGSSLKWTFATDAAAAANFGRWQLHFAESGTYRVEAFTPAPYNGSKATIYEVRHGETVTRIPIDQSAVDGWNLVGELDFVADSTEQYVRVDDNTGEPSNTDTKIVFDALRFTKVTAQDIDEEPPPPAANGCSSSRGDASLLVLLGAFLFRRRRADNS